MKNVTETINTSICNTIEVSRTVEPMTPPSPQKANEHSSIDSNLYYNSDNNEEQITIEQDKRYISKFQKYVFKTNVSTFLRKNHEIEGRRMINVFHFFEQIMNFPHHGLFSCSNQDVKIVREIRKGFMSKFVLKCGMCKVEYTVDGDYSGGELNSNGAAVTGILSIGCGFSQLNEFTSCLNMPGISWRLYKKIEDELSEIFENESCHSMIEAGKEEFQIAVENGNVDEHGTPLLSVIADGAWCKRSYRTNYNANSGAACIVGEKTGKILFLGIRNKYCFMCSQQNSNANSHVCFKNWDAPSSGMESDIILEGFKRSVEIHGVKYAFLVGDGDSSVYRKILDARPYGSFVVQKVECSNHLLRNYVTKLTDLSKKKYSSKANEVDIFYRHSLKTNIQRLRLSVVCAIKHRRSEDISYNEKVENLKKDIANSISHVFGDHNYCDQYFCKGRKLNERNLIPAMKECGMFNDIMVCANRLICHSTSLIKNMTNNSAENYNSVLAKFIGGKRIDYSKRGSYSMRCHLAGISINAKGGFLNSIHKAVTGNSPGVYTKKFVRKQENRRKLVSVKRRLYRSASKLGENRRIKRMRMSDSDDNDDYGANVHALDITSGDLQNKKADFVQNLRKTEEQILALSNATEEQSQSQLWFAERRKRLTASSFGRICKMRVTTDPKKFINNLLHHTFYGNISTNYGKDHESIARREFAETFGQEIVECGFFIGKSDCYLGATPDGLIGKDGIIEIKCPYNARLHTPEEAIILKKVKFATYKDNVFSLKRNDNYFYQVQGQLHVTERKYCYFILWTPQGMLFEKIYKDNDFFIKNMKKKLHDFFFNHYIEALLKLEVKNEL